MNEPAKLNRQVFDKDKFKETINTEFNQLVEQPDPTFFDPELATIEDFFTLYNKFFFEIPKLGETNSHEFLIKESTEYVGFEAVNEQIQALLDEIAALREENLELRKNEAIGVANQFTDKKFDKAIQSQLPNL